MLFTCPLPASLESIPVSGCPIRFDQIVRLVFQRVQAAAAEPLFSESTMKTLATWTPLLAASAGTKVQATPLFAELVIPQSEALTTGGNDNTTFNGLPVYNGEGSVTVTAQMSDIGFDVKKALQEYTKYSIPSSIGATTLSAFLINKDGQIISDNYHGIPIYNFRISSVGSEGFNAANKFAIGFSLAPNWDNNLVMVKPDFDPLTQL